MESFNFFFGISLGYLVIRHGDNFFAALQKANISAADGKRVASMTVSALAEMRSEKAFNLLWESVKSKMSSFDISEPKLPGKRK